MENLDRRKNSLKGNEGHGVHLCSKCGWPFPNPRPSAKNRRAHKKVCGTIEGYKLGDNKTHSDADDDEHLSKNDSKILTNGSEEVDKMTEMAVSKRSFSGFSCGSIRSTRSEEDVFADAVTDFTEGSGISDSDDIREPVKKKEISEVVADAGGSDTPKIDVPTQYHHISTSTLDSSSNSGLNAREVEISVTENMSQCSEISVVLGPEDKRSVEEALDKNSVDMAGSLTENAVKTSKVVFVPQKAKEDSLEFVLENPVVEVTRKQNDVFNETEYCSTKYDFDDQMKSLKDSVRGTEDANVKADSISCTKETFSNMCLVQRIESLKRNSTDVIFEGLHQEDSFAEEVSVENKIEKNDIHVTGANTEMFHVEKDTGEASQRKEITEEPVAVADINLQSFLDNSDNPTLSNSSLKSVYDDLERENKGAEFSDAIEEADSLKEAEEELPLTNETSISGIHYPMEDNLLRVNGDGYDVGSTVAEKLSESKPSVSELEDRMDDKLGVEREYEHALTDLGCHGEQMVVAESGSAVVATSIPNVGEKVKEASEYVDVSLTPKVKNNDSQLENEISRVRDLENVGDKMSGEECTGKVDLGLISDNDDSFDLYQNATGNFDVGQNEEAVSAVEDSSTKEKGGTASGHGDTKLGKQEEVVSEPDIQVDSFSQTDSLEGNWGSVSVLSTLSDTPAATDTGSQPKSHNGKSEILKPPPCLSSIELKAGESDQNEAPTEAQTSQKPQVRGVRFESLTSTANDTSGRKKNEEMIAKVTNWSTGKQHMSLKSYLGESSSPIAKDNPPPGSQETVKTVMDTKERLDNAIKGELGKEWNSPARYPANIKREKAKVKRPYWAPFICCSSVQTS